ncbi:hypothetical protein FRC0306_02108 [Corynebacterium diphtheriae]|nr:hypothetical protein FRC0306_02108 [Corynebacterium diphtheriae]
MDGLQGYATATQVIDLFHVVRLADDNPRGRLEKLFDFDDDYALLGRTMNKCCKDTPRLLRPLHLVVPDPRRQHPTHNQCPPTTGRAPKRGYFEGFFTELHTKSLPNRPFEQIWCEVPSFRGGERGWRVHQHPPTPAKPGQAMVVKTSHSAQGHARTPGELINAL